MRRVPPDHEYDERGQCKWCEHKDQSKASLAPAHGSADRGGNCDIYKLECKIRIMRAALEEVLSHRQEDKDGNYVMWIGEGTFLKCEAALNPPNAKLSHEAGAKDV